MAAIVTLELRRTQRLVGVGIALALVVGADPAPAQSLAAVARASTEARVAGGAESFAREYQAAFQSRDWNKVARLIHPTALAEFRAMMRPLLLSTNPKAAEVRAVFTGSDSIAAIDAMPDAAFFSAVMSRVFALMPKDLTDALFTASSTVIGSVVENADTTHVLCRVRMSAAGVSVTELDVITAKRTGDGWTAALSGSLSTTLRQLSASAQ